MNNRHQQLVTDAWERLWDKDKFPQYYLPAVITAGVKANGIAISPLGTLDMPSLGPFTLFHKKPWGAVAITFNNNSMSGLGTMTNRGIAVAPDGLSFSAKVGIDQHHCSGSFDVLASGLSTSAIDSVWALGEAPHLEDTASDTQHPNPHSDAGLEAARQYRSHLLNQGANGRFLVGTYYDNNEVYNTIANDPKTAFNYNWAYYHTPGLGPDGRPVTVNSISLSDQTTQAAANPESSSHVIGYDAYNKHAYIGQGLMIKSITHQIKKLKDSYPLGTAIPPSVQKQIDKLHQARKATFIFAENTHPVTKQHTNGLTVKEVMHHVATSEPITHSSAYEQYKKGKSLTEALRYYDFLYREAMLQAEALAEDFLHRQQAGTLEPRTASTTLTSGTYTLTLAVPTLTFSGTITLEQGKPKVNIVSATSDIPFLPYLLHAPDPDTELAKEVLQHYKSATYIHRLAQQKVNTALGTTKFLQYMSERINQSIDQVFR